jgi:hypothetical protein
LLELIFQGFVEWMYGLTLECWEYFSSILWDLMNLDFSYLRAHMPIITTIQQSMLAVGWALLIGNFVFQAIKSMISGLGFDGEDPKMLFARTFVFAFLLLASPQICTLCLNMTSTVIGIMEMPDAVNIVFANEASFGGLSAAWLLVVICGIIVMFQSFKLVFEMAERYFILAVLTICAPLAFGTGGSKNTSDIFGGWCRMYGSMCLLMVLNVVFIKMLLSVLSYYPSGLDVLPWIVLVMVVVKVAKKADAIVTRIGLNPAITGDALGRSLPGMLTYTVVRTAASRITSTIGKNSGEGNRGRGPSTPPGGSGGPRTGSQTGGWRSAAASGAAASNTSYSQQTSSGQTSTQQNTTQQGTVQQGTAQPGTAQPGTSQQCSPYFSTQQSATDQSVRTTVANSSQHSQSDILGGQTQSTRKSSVPPGMRRSPTHTSVAAALGTVAVSSNSETPGAVPQSGASGRPGSVRLGTAGKPTGGMAGGKPSAAQPGTAGKTSPPGNSRLTNISGHTTREGAVNSSIHAKEQNNISVGTPRTVSPTQASASPPTMVPPGTATSHSTSTAKTETRFTQRQSPAAHTGAQAPAQTSGLSAAAQTSGPQSDPAGTADAGLRRQPVQEPRYSRKEAPIPSAVSSKTTQFSTARQEPRQSASTPTPPTQGTTSATQPGMAGTATYVQRQSQTRQTARNQAARAKSVPTAADSLGGKRVSSLTSDLQRRSQQRKSSVKPPDRQGGTKHGRTQQ